MMKSEFIDRVGFEPTSAEYEVIERYYYDFDGNKDEFCTNWVIEKKAGRWEPLRKAYEQILSLEARERQTARDLRELKERKAAEIEEIKAGYELIIDQLEAYKEEQEREKRIREQAAEMLRLLFSGRS